MTADSINVVVYVAPETDPILDFITAAINNDDTNAAGAGDDAKASSTCSGRRTRPTGAP